MATIHAAEGDGQTGEACVPASSPRRWAKRLGAAAFLFFLVKGLMWLVVPTVVAVLAAR